MWRPAVPDAGTLRRRRSNEAPGQPERRWHDVPTRQLERYLVDGSHPARNATQIGADNERQCCLMQQGDPMPKVVLAEVVPPFVAKQLQALLPGAELDAIQDPTDEELARRAAAADVLVTARAKVDAHTLALTPGVRLSSSSPLTMTTWTSTPFERLGSRLRIIPVSTAAAWPSTRSC